MPTVDNPLDQAMAELNRLGWSFSSLQYLPKGSKWRATADDQTIGKSIHADSADYRNALIELIKKAGAQPTPTERHAAWNAAKVEKANRQIEQDQKRRMSAAEWINEKARPKPIKATRRPGRATQVEPTLTERRSAQGIMKAPFHTCGSLAYQLGVSPRKVRETAAKLAIHTDTYSEDEVIHIIYEINRA